MHAPIDRQWLFALRELQEPEEGDLVSEVIRLFLTTSDERVARARAALARADARAVRFEAHALRGSAGVIGAADLRTAAAEVETAAEMGDLRRLARCVDAMARATLEVQAALAALADAGPSLQEHNL